MVQLKLEIKLSVVVSILAATTITPIAALPLPVLKLRKYGKPPIEKNDFGIYYTSPASWCVDVQ
jgi:hypothetical protein